MTSPKLSVEISFFVSCFNEEENICHAFNAICEGVGDIPFEIIVIDDGSRDSSAKKIQQYAETHPNVHLQHITNKKNIGLGASYFKGVDFAQGEYYMLLMGDYNIPSQAIQSIVQLRREADMVVPYIDRDERHWTRCYLSILFASIIRILSGHNLRYFNADGCLQRTENVRRYKLATSGFGYLAELICVILNNGAIFREIPIKYFVRKSPLSSALRIKNIISVLKTLGRILRRRIARNFRK